MIADTADLYVKHDENDSFSFRLQLLATIASRIAVLSIGSRYRLTIGEWRAMSLLYRCKEAPLQLLADRSGLLKSQMSRVVSGLIDRGIISRSGNPRDGRSILLRLTKVGEEIARQIDTDSEHDNKKMLSSLSAKDREQLNNFLEAVLENSKKYCEELRQRIDDRAAAADTDE